MGLISSEEGTLESRKGRFLALRALIVLAFIILVAQLWLLQVVQGAVYRNQADLNRLRVYSARAPRGVIYDRRGILLVRNVPSFTVSILPADLPKSGRNNNRSKTPEPGPSRAQVFARLGNLLHRSAAEIQRAVEEGQAQNGLYEPVTIGTNVERDTAFLIEEQSLALPGVRVDIEPVRQYVEGALLSHIVGYVARISPQELEKERESYSASDRVGKTGVELTYERELRGSKGKKQVEVDAQGREVRLLYQMAPRPGDNLTLTIDLELQRQITRALEEGMRGANSKAGAVVALDPQSGQVLAMVSLPSYDNNLFSGDISKEDYQRLTKDPMRPLFNRAVGAAYPPGSTFKMVTASAGLQDRVVKKDTVITCNGVLVIPHKYDPTSNYKFWCYVRSGHGPLTIVDAIAYSCDVFFYSVGGGFEDFVGLGVNRLGKYASDFGLGASAGIDLPGESPGLVPNEKWKLAQPFNIYQEPWLTGDTYNMSIGQGYLLSSVLQMANVTAAVANGGTLYKPQVVYQVSDSEGKVIRPFAPQKIRTLPISKANLEIVREGMTAAVSHGTARGLGLTGVTAAGKTGTAEYGAPDAQGAHRAHAWFAAFAPVENPRIALVVFVEDGGNGAKVAVPIAARILKYYFGLPEGPP
jgi:penicillin-binding protein 2